MPTLFWILFLSLCLNSLAQLQFLSYNPYEKITHYTVGDNRTLKVGIISDAQLKGSPSDDKYNYTIHLERALLTLKANNIEVLVFAGDISNSGTEYAFETFTKTFNSVYPTNKPLLDIIMGNHDYWTDPRIPSINQERFEKMIGQKPLGHKVINGFHFINWGSIDGSYDKCNSNTQWAKEQIELSIKDDKSKPVFVITHLPPSNTMYGSDDWGNNDITELLKNYPQVISFSGHTHYPLLDERSIWQGEYTAINTQSVSYTEMENGKENGSIPQDEYGDSSIAKTNYMGLIMEVNSALVKIKRIALITNTFYNRPWLIDLPVNPINFRYKTTERASKSSIPYFNPDTTVKLIKVPKYQIYQIEFKQAIHENHVHSYKVILNSEGSTPSELLYFSDFYLMPTERKEYIKLKLPKTLLLKDYSILITAIESFGKESKPIQGYINLLAFHD